MDSGTSLGKDATSMHSPDVAAANVDANASDALGSDGAPVPDVGALDDASAAADSATAIDATSVPDAGQVVDLCPQGESFCSGHDTVRQCVATPSGLRLVDAVCPAGSGCVRGQCVPGACSDECVLGDSMMGRSCELYDVAQGQWSTPDPTTSLHDRARAITEWLRRDGLAAGGVGGPTYADPPLYSQLSNMDDIGDSALWTGTYLAAEALRLKATGAPDARSAVRRLASTLHDWLSVSGDPGMLARYAKTSSTHFPFTIPDLDCSAQRTHCGVQYKGTAWDYVGHISRDQYQGVMLGDTLAYEALPDDDSAIKDMIRSDVVTVVQELMRERMVPVQVTINNVPLPPTIANVRFVVLNTHELTNGAIQLTIDLSNTSNAQMYGFQEFTPDLSLLIHELPGFGWVPPIPRSSSAIMLASFFRDALMMTQSDPRFAATHSAILDYYMNHSGPGGNVHDWMTIAQTWSDSGGCGANYYGNNITMEPMYNLARLESDATLKGIIVDQILGNRMWPVFQTAKNCFFSYIYAGVTPGADPMVAASASTQLGQYPPPPRVWRAVDLRNDPRYMPHDASCTDQVVHSMAVDVSDRVFDGFIWQRDPWSLYDAGNINQTGPGVDYLVAYWMARAHGFMSDDTPNSCLAWH
jgi:hypothetical protein